MPSATSDHVITTLRYAKADAKALSEEKAYILNYDVPAGVPKSNFSIEYYQDIPVKSLRDANLDFYHNGLTTATLPQCMPKEDFDDEAKVESTYLPEIHRCIQKALGVDEVYIFDYMIRKREPAFPYQPKKKDNAPQPALSAHVGMSLVVSSNVLVRAHVSQITRQMRSEAV